MPQAANRRLPYALKRAPTASVRERDGVCIDATYLLAGLLFALQHRDRIFAELCDMLLQHLAYGGLVRQATTLVRQLCWTSKFRKQFVPESVKDNCQVVTDCDGILACGVMMPAGPYYSHCA